MNTIRRLIAVTLAGLFLVACGDEPVRHGRVLEYEDDAPDAGKIFATGDASASSASSATTMGACQTGATQACYPGKPGEAGVGACKQGTQTCGASGTWGNCEGAVVPTAEVCGDKVDNDCNGKIDETCPCTYTREAATSVCCAAGDTLKTFVDCGSGQNHTASAANNCGEAHEGSGNYGSACVRITCEGKPGTCTQ